MQVIETGTLISKRTVTVNVFRSVIRQLGEKVPVFRVCFAPFRDGRENRHHAEEHGQPLPNARLIFSVLMSPWFELTEKIKTVVRPMPSLGQQTKPRARAYLLVRLNVKLCVKLSTVCEHEFQPRLKKKYWSFFFSFSQKNRAFISYAKARDKDQKLEI